MKTLAQIQMFERVNATLEENLKKWDHLAAFRKTYDLFMKNLVKLRRMMQNKPENTDRLIPVKKKTADLLIKSAVPVANALEVYGRDHDKKLSKLIRIKKEKIIKSKDTTILKKGELVLKKGRKLLAKALKDAKKENSAAKASIMDYGITDAMLKKLEGYVIRFKKESGELRAIDKEIKESAARMDNLVSKNRRILTDKLDKLMVIFESKNNGFYTSYFEARNIPKAESKKRSRAGKQKSRATASNVTSEAPVAPIGQQVNE